MVLAVQSGKEERTVAMLWLTSYLFLLRLPSEVMRRWMPACVPVLHLFCRHFQHAKCSLMPRARRASSQSFGWRMKQYASGFCGGRTDLRGAVYSDVCAPVLVVPRRVLSILYGISFWPSYLMEHTPGGGSLQERRVTG